jgi:signal peptidase II
MTLTLQRIRLGPHRRLALVASTVLVLDQLSKFLVTSFLQDGQQRVIVSGFFKFVYWGNTGAAWSLFYGNNGLLAVVSVLALVALFFGRRQFDFHTLPGQVALGLMFGGILGNLIDRWRVHHVIDFIRFYLNCRSGAEVGFPAFNLADSSICLGVGLLFVMSFRNEAKRSLPTGAQSGAARPVNS